MALVNEMGSMKMISPFSIVRAVSFVFVIFFVQWIVRGIYRIYFHPLKRFPGPKFSAFTRLPYLTAAYKGVLTKHVARLHEEYGEVVRISPDELSFLHPQAWRDIYGHGAKEGKGSAPPKNWPRYGKSLNGSESLVTIEDPAEHSHTRKVFVSAFSDRALTQQTPLFTKYTDQLVRSLKAGGKEGAIFDMVRMYNFTTFDVMGDLTFGESLHMLDNAEYDPWVKIIFDNVKKGTQLGLLQSFYPFLAGILSLLLQKRIAKVQHEHFNLCIQRVTKRLEKGRASEGVDLWDLVLKREEKGEEVLTRAEMDKNADLFMVAGTETTATLLSGLTYLLLSNPETMEKLTNEIRSAFVSSDDISLTIIAGLPYLNACIKEALRLYPPVPGGLWHKTPAGGSTICGHYVPPNITVTAPHQAMYTSPKFFKDPLSFIPERWTGDERFINDERSTLQPFSVGPRDCLGKNMAWHEMRLILAKVLFNFDLGMLPESKGWLDDQPVYTLWQKPPLKVKVTSVSV